MKLCYSVWGRDSNTDPLQGRRACCVWSQRHPKAPGQGSACLQFWAITVTTHWQQTLTKPPKSPWNPLMRYYIAQKGKTSISVLEMSYMFLLPHTTLDNLHFLAQAFLGLWGWFEVKGKTCNGRRISQKAFIWVWSCGAALGSRLRGLVAMLEFWVWCLATDELSLIILLDTC